jgi:antitoxin VapB
MPKKTIAKLFRNGRSQAVRLPQEFRFEGEAVRVRRAGDTVVLQPIISNIEEWFAKMDALNTEPFLARGRKQPKTPRRKIFD